MWCGKPRADETLRRRSAGYGDPIVQRPNNLTHESNDPPPLRVVELSESLSGAFAGLLLTAVGAVTYQLRAGLDRRLDDVESAYYDRGRFIVTEDVDVSEFVREADVLLSDVSADRLRAMGLCPACGAPDRRYHGLVQVSVTAFGLTGPHADFVTEDITEWAAGGMAYVTRRAVADDDDAGYVPIIAPGRQPELIAAVAATIGTLSALRLAASGPPVLVDVSRQEVLAGLSHSHFPIFVNNNLISGGLQARLSTIGMLLHTADNRVLYLRTTERHQWDALVELMDSPAWTVALEDGTPLYLADPALVGELVGEWAKGKTSTWLLAEGRRRRIPFAVPRGLSDVLAAEQIGSREALTQVMVDGRAAVGPKIPLLEPVAWPTSSIVGADEALALCRGSARRR